MIGRLVGQDEDGCTYSLVARITLSRFWQLSNDEVPVEHAFDDSRDIALCSVFESERGPSNVIPVQHYHHVEDVPANYLPPSPFLQFTGDSAAP